MITKVIEERINQIPQISSQLENIMSGGTVDSNELKLIAHRGFSISEPENSIPAYIKASQKGFKYAECDVQVTSDGKFYLMHDNTLDRTTNGTGRMQEKTSAYINSLIIDGSNGANKYPNLKIPTLVEFLDCCTKYKLTPVIEVNPTCTFTDNDILNIYNIVKNKDMLRDSIFISFNLINLSRLIEIDSSLKTGYLADITAETIQTCKTNNIKMLGIDVNLITPAKVNLAKTNNIKVNVWTVNTVNKAMEVKAFGVDYITTDLIVEVV